MSTYADVFTGDDRWRELDTPEGELFAWAPDSTYVRLPPYFEGMSPEPGTVDDFSGARLPSSCSETPSRPITFLPQGPSRRQPGREVSARARGEAPDFTPTARVAEITR